MQQTKLVDRLEGPEFYLKMIDESDITSEYINWLNDTEVNRFLELRFNPPNHLQQCEFIADFDQKNNLVFGIYEKKSKKLIGSYTLRKSKVHNFGTFGYLIGSKEHWGTNAGLASCCLGLDFAFIKLNLRRIEGGVYANNIRSIVNFKKLGFKEEGRRRQQLKSGNLYVDNIQYGILKDEWLEHRKKFSYLGLKELTSV